MTQNKKITDGDFQNQYKLSKTLRFSLLPVGKTGENMKAFLIKDEKRAEEYKIMKEIIDEYHKWFIDERLKNFSFSLENLQVFQELYEKLKKDRNNESLRKELEKNQAKLRKEVSLSLKNDRIFKQEFIKKDLGEWVKKNKEKVKHIDNPEKIIKEFKKWTTYFKGFNENRKNIYTDKEHSTSIGYRLIHQNLPKFLDNIQKYKDAVKFDVDFSEVEKTFSAKLDNFSMLQHFNKCLTQKGIDVYNLVVGGKSRSAESRLGGMNEKINLFSQNKKNKDKVKKIRSCVLDELYKQILSDRNELSFKFETIENDGKLCERIQETIKIVSGDCIMIKNKKDKKTEEGSKEEINVTQEIKELLKHLQNANAKELYLKNNVSLTTISQNIFGKWGVVSDSLKFYAQNEKLGKNKKGEAKILSTKEQEKWVEKTEYFTFHEIHSALEMYFSSFSDEELKKEKKDKKTDENPSGLTLEMKKKAKNAPLFHYFKKKSIKKKSKETNEFEEVELFSEIEEKYHLAEGVLKKYLGAKTEYLRSEKKEVENIKEYLDSVMDLLHFLKPLALETKGKSGAYQKDDSFYNNFNKVYEFVSQIIPLYNQARNYLTKKVATTEKYKLNFENTTLANGWDKNKETDNTCVLLLKDEKYFLGVMKKEHNKLFTGKLDKMGDCYQKMHYKLLPGASKMLPKVFFGGSNIGYYQPSERIVEIRNHGTHTKGGTPQKGYEKGDFSLNDMREMVDFFKKSIEKHKEWRNYDFTFSKTEDYEDISAFYREVENQGYKITYDNVSEDYVNQCVEEGKLHLFQIYNKDFSPHSKGKPNLHTLYWKALFSDENLKNVVYKLNGEAELFHRKPSLKKPFVHTVGSILKHKTSANVWKDLGLEIGKKQHRKEDIQSISGVSINADGKIFYDGKNIGRIIQDKAHEITKDRRYSKDTFFFHVPITLNFKAQGAPKFNDKVNLFLKNNPKVKILSIDRGERHLAYYTLIDQKGNIEEQNTFNLFGKTDYQKLLDDRETERDDARKSWQTIEKIKDLKEGYLSQVVHKIAEMVVKHNAIVVFEDLNFGFKKGRFKVEKQIYQKLEKALIDKLNYLVFKDKNVDEPGGLLKALQLTEKFESFKEMGKQTGIIFYVPAYHTSKICPATGFVNLLYPKHETFQKSQEFFGKFESISYNKEKKYFEFAFNYKNFTEKAAGSKQGWVLCSIGERLENFKNDATNNKWSTRTVKLTEELTKLFESIGIDSEKQGGIKESIVQQTSGTFFKELTHLLKLTLQMRNSEIGTDVDWIISPVRDENGAIFCSDEKQNKSIQEGMPKNADANGAYHIGLKGLWVLGKINEWDGKGKTNFTLTNKEWYKFAQEKRFKQ